MNKKQVVNNNENLKQQGSLKPVSSPISQGKLVSKVNALTNSSAVNQLLNPQSMVFNNEKSFTLNYKYVMDALVNISNISNASDFYNKVYSIITQTIDSSFFAVGLFKEKSEAFDCVRMSGATLS